MKKCVSRTIKELKINDGNKVWKVPGGSITHWDDGTDEEFPVHIDDLESSLRWIREHSQ